MLSGIRFLLVIVGLLIVFPVVDTSSGAIPASNKTEIFISPKGKDNNQGTADAPLKSLEKAKQLARLILKEASGSTVIISVGHGTYPLEKVVAFSGEDFANETNNIIIKASEKAKPVFTGSRRLGEWQVFKDKSK